MIEVINLSKTYKKNIKEPGLKGAVKNLFHTQWVEKKAINDISFKMEPGTTLACIGENGAGKSTLIKMMIGILEPTEGEVKIFGQKPTKGGQNYLRNIGVIFGQKSNLWIDIPVIESYNAMKTLYKIDKEIFRKNYEMVVELLDLSDIINYPVRKLSLGQRMKADIGMIFLHNPSLLFLDEPTIGLDINIKHTIRTFLREMNKEKGTSIFLTSHDLDDIDEICDNAIVLSHGKLIFDGSLDSLKHRYVKDKMIQIVGHEKENVQLLLEGAKVTKEGRRTKIVFSEESYSLEHILNIVFRTFDIEDITIQEPDIDEVVSQIFLQEE